MSIYRYTSIKEIIGKAYRDLNVQDSERFTDMIEWIAEALEAIGTPEQLELVVDKYCIKDYKLAIPCGLFRLNYVYYNGYPLLPNSSAMGNSMLNYNTISNITSPDPITLDKLNGNPALLDIRFTRSENQHKFTLDPAYIRTTFKEGDIYLSYYRIPLDEDGFPLVPDDYSFKTACFWYIAKMLAMPAWFAGDNNRYLEAESKWQFYCGQAAAKAMMPDLTRLENIKNQWVRLIPNINRGSTFFNNLSQQERVNI